MDINDVEACYRAVKSRDRRFDGCILHRGPHDRHLLPAELPRRDPEAAEHDASTARAAAAQGAGFRACKRCLPDATPGSPEWNVSRRRRRAGDAADRRRRRRPRRRRGPRRPARLQRPAANRLLTAELGAGPLALARAQRAQTARTLIETTELRLRRRRVRVRLRERAPVQRHRARGLRRSPTRAARAARQAGRPRRRPVDLRLAVRSPFDAAEPARVLRPARGPGRRGGRRRLVPPHAAAPARCRQSLELAARPDGGIAWQCTLRLDDLRDLGAAVERCRRLLDPDSDPVAVDALLASDPRARPAGRGAAPGLRVPGHVDGDEIAVRAVLGQQVTVAPRARTRPARAALRRAARQPDATAHPPLPDAAALAGARPRATCRCRGARARAERPVRGAARRHVALDRGADRATSRRDCSRCPASARGPPTTSRCARSAIPTSSCPPIRRPQRLSPASVRDPDRSSGAPGGPTPSFTCGTP